VWQLVVYVSVKRLSDIALCRASLVCSWRVEQRTGDQHNDSGKELDGIRTTLREAPAGASFKRL